MTTILDRGSQSQCAGSTRGIISFSAVRLTVSITIVHHLVVTWDMVGIDKSQTSELAQVNGPRSVQSLFVTLSASQPHSSTLPIQIQGAATMTQKEFFSDLVWLGKIIRFSHSTDTSGWRLETKYNDKNDQLTAEDTILTQSTTESPVQHTAPSVVATSRMMVISLY